MSIDWKIPGDQFKLQLYSNSPVQIWLRKPSSFTYFIDECCEVYWSSPWLFHVWTYWIWLKDNSCITFYVFFFSTPAFQTHFLIFISANKCIKLKLQTLSYNIFNGNIKPRSHCSRHKKYLITKAPFTKISGFKLLFNLYWSMVWLLDWSAAGGAWVVRFILQRASLVFSKATS